MTGNRRQFGQNPDGGRGIRVQFATGSFTGTLAGLVGGTHGQVSGYTFDTQHFPDSPNHASFPSTELDAGQTFTSTTIYQFSLPSLF